MELSGYFSKLYRPLIRVYTHLKDNAKTYLLSETLDDTVFIPNGKIWLVVILSNAHTLDEIISNYLAILK